MISVEELEKIRLGEIRTLYRLGKHILANVLCFGATAAAYSCMGKKEPKEVERILERLGDK